MSIFDCLPDAFKTALGEDLVYVPPGGGYERNIVGLWEAEHIAIDGIAGVPIDSVAPAVHAADADIDFIDQGGEIVRQGVCYKVRSVRPDGKGMTTLILEKVKSNG